VTKNLQIQGKVHTSSGCVEIRRILYLAL